MPWATTTAPPTAATVRRLRRAASGMSDPFLGRVVLDGGEHGLHRDAAAGNELSAGVPYGSPERSGPQVLPDEHRGRRARRHRHSEVRHVLLGQDGHQVSLEGAQVGEVTDAGVRELERLDHAVGILAEQEEVQHAHQAALHEVPENRGDLALAEVLTRELDDHPVDRAEYVQLRCGRHAVVLAAVAASRPSSVTRWASDVPPSSVSLPEIPGSSSTFARTPTAALPDVSSAVMRVLSASDSPSPLWCRAPAAAPPARPTPRPTGVSSTSTAPTPVPLMVLRDPTLSVLSSPLSLRTRIPMASPLASPEPLSSSAAASAAVSSSKTLITSCRSVMEHPLRRGTLLTSCLSCLRRSLSARPLTSSVTDEPRGASAGSVRVRSPASSNHVMSCRCTASAPTSGGGVDQPTGWTRTASLCQPPSPP